MGSRSPDPRIDPTCFDCDQRERCIAAFEKQIRSSFAWLASGRPPRRLWDKWIADIKRLPAVGNPEDPGPEKVRREK